MNEYTKLFERASERIPVADLPLEGMLRRRDRRRRNSRLAAGAVGIAAALAAIFIGTSVIRPNAHVPATPPTVRNGDITFVVNGGLVGVSPAGARTNLLPGCCELFGGWMQGADWSPDGTRFAFGLSSGEPKGIPIGVYVFNAATGESNRVVDGPVESLEWSPDGSSIVFSDFATIIVVDADGSTRTTLWAGAGNAADPSWSPDGTQIAFAVYGRSAGADGPSTARIHVIDAAGSGDRAITSATDGQASAPAWSPDGSRIAYINRCNIRLMSPDGAGRVLLRHIEDCPARGLSGPGDAAFSDAAQLVWSPDGTRIAFNLWRVDDSFPLYMMLADGTALERLTVPSGASPPIAWQPVP